MTANVTCYRYEPGCGYNGGQGKVNDALEVGIKNRHFANPFEGEESASWIAWDREVVANVSQIDDAALEVEMDFSTVTVRDPGF